MPTNVTIRIIAADSASSLNVQSTANDPRPCVVGDTIAGSHVPSVNSSTRDSAGSLTSCHTLNTERISDSDIVVQAR